MKPTIRLNRQKLELRKGKEYAEVAFIGDLHLGHPQSWVTRAKEMLDFCLKTGIYVFFMGDLMESGLTSSIGDSVYQQKLNPQEQMEAVIDLIAPVCGAKLCLGYLAGNHEYRIKKQTGIDVAKIIANTVRVPYLQYACWNLWYAGKQSYSIYTFHGKSGSRFIHTKIKAAMDIAHYFMGDLVVMAHVHDLGTEAQERQTVDKVKKAVVVKKQYVVLSGHYLGYDRSYAQESGYPPSKIGSPKIMFYSTRHDLHIVV